MTALKSANGKARALVDKVAIVTGATRGIGRAIAEALAEAGARVVISSRKRDACEQTCLEMRAAGHQVLPVPAHVGKPDDIDNLVSLALEAFGGIDIVVCNAAVNPVFAPLQDISEEIWSKVLETNLTSVWRMAKAVLPHVAAQGGGAMVLISSTASLVGTEASGPYAVSKAAENHLAKQLAVEWGPKNIRVNVIAPGLTRTDMIRNHDPDWVKRSIAQTPLRRMGEPRDIAEVALFLASDSARHLTGQLLVVDGGLMLLGPR